MQQLLLSRWLRPLFLSIALVSCLSGDVGTNAQGTPPRPSGRTLVGINGSMFTINRQPTYTTASGFPDADPNLTGTLLNVRAVQGVFDDANYPKGGTKVSPYASNTMAPVFFDYPDGKFDPDRNVQEFVEALPDWRKAGLLAFTVNFQGGGPVDGNYGEDVPMQPHYNSGFDPQGNLKPAYGKRMEKVLDAADRLGMVVIVGFFYQGSDERIEIVDQDKHLRSAVVNGIRFLKSLPYRNVLIEINNETSVRGYSHPMLQPDGIYELVRLAKEEAGKDFPVSMSWSGGIMPPGSKGDLALRMVDYVMIHTNGRTPEQVHETIQAQRRWTGYDRPLLINEDGVSTFNLRAAVQERVGWGFYDQGWSNYRDGFQSPPVNWRISTPVKWQFFEQVARLSGSPIPERPAVNDPEYPVITIFGLKRGQVLTKPSWIEAIVQDKHPRWPIHRVEFFIDGKPFSYSRTAPFMLGNREWWDPRDLTLGAHTLRVVAYDLRGPRFTETCAIEEIPFTVGSMQ